MSHDTTIIYRTGAGYQAFRVTRKGRYVPMCSPTTFDRAQAVADGKRVRV